MASATQPEVWQRGPVPGVPPLLQPVAHALIQANEEVAALMDGFPEALLWIKPAGLASVAFHLQHMSGVIDRLFTYANGEQLSVQQLDNLANEGLEQGNISVKVLISNFNEQVSKALLQLTHTSESLLTQPRGVGRAKIPSNVAGLLFHAAEHTMRHLGQLIVTAKTVEAGYWQ